jgi:hypothetical protein
LCTQDEEGEINNEGVEYLGCMEMRNVSDIPRWWRVFRQMVNNLNKIVINVIFVCYYVCVLCGIVRLAM